MSEHVLVHGAWHGGWCWERVARILAGRGTGVHTPTAPGLGDRADDHTTGLHDHVDDLVDGWTAADGESLLERAPDWFASSVRAAAPAGAHSVPVPPVELLGVTDPADAAYLEARLTPQPFATFTEPTRLSGAGDGIPGTAIGCRPGSGLPFDELAAAIGDEIVDLASGHDAMISAPAQLADLILDAN